MTKRNKGRDLNGLLILDKAIGLSSNKCLQQVKHLLGAAKAGHTGSLDPLASGVLPLCFGEATKISQFLLDSDKVYQATIRLGITTTSGDSDGERLSEAEVPDFTLADIQSVLRQFHGVITQQPSIYSALKQDGVPLYRLARAGKPIRPKYREVTIRSLELLEWIRPLLKVTVSCSKGTYVRTLAEDIGSRLGCGAHLTALRRLQAGPFGLDTALTLGQMQQLAESGELEQRLLPADMAISTVPALVLTESDTRRLRQGQAVILQQAMPEGQELRIYCGPEFIGMAMVGAKGELRARRLQKYTMAGNGTAPA